MNIQKNIIIMYIYIYINIQMRIIPGWCPLSIRKIFAGIWKMLGFANKKSKTYEGLHDEFEDEEKILRKTSGSTLKQKKNVVELEVPKSTKSVEPIEVTSPTSPNQIKTFPQQYLFDDHLERDILLPVQIKQTNNQKSKDKLVPEVTSLLQDTTPLIEEIEIPKKHKKQQLQPEQHLLTITSSNNMNNNNITVATQLQQQQVPSFIAEIQTTNFRINLEPYEKHYELLQSKAKNLKQKFNLTNAIPVEIQKNPWDLQIRYTHSDKINILLYSFKLPCTYSYYNSMLNDYSLQKKIDSNIDEFKMLELVTNNARINYLSYKKILIITPRDFVYMKYSNNWENEYYDISFSIPYDPTPNKVRGEIILSACKIIEKNEQIFVNVYSQVDMKLSVSPKITKNQAINQIKKYVQRSDKYIRQNYRKQLA